MAFITDPDNLDRFQVCVDPEAQTISLRGFGDTIRGGATPYSQTGDSDGTVGFDDTGGGDFVTDSVAAGDILTIISDPGSDGLIIGHYEVADTILATSFNVDRSIPASLAADLTYSIHAPDTQGQVGETLADGVTMQALYSFLKEEWRTLSAGLGGAADLIQFTFPIESITREQFEVGGPTHENWSFATGFATAVGVPSTRELLRTGGWQEQDSTGRVIQDYAGIITLGSLDSDAQAYFQQHTVTSAPQNFVLTGPVNQSINTYFLPSTTPIGNLAITATNTITRTGDWTADGFETGGLVTITDSENTGENDGTFRVVSVTATVMVVESEDGTDTTPLVNNADDDTMLLAVNKRKFLVLRARKKARTYPEADLADAGVAFGVNDTGIETIVTRFGLSHATDPAIAFDDGEIAGDAVNTVFTGVETHTSNTDGATASNGDGTFTFTSAASTFDNQARSLDILQPGDSLEITTGTAATQGFYEIISVATTTVTCFEEPTKGAIASESTLSFTTRARVRDVGAAVATLANATGLTGTLTDATPATFGVDSGLGDRNVVAGDMVIVTAGTAGVIGAYKVISQDSATQLTLDTSDQIFAGETNQTYKVVRAGMYLQRFETLATNSDGTSIAIADASPDTITRSAGDFTTDGFLDGMALTVLDAEDAGNIGTFVIDTAATTVLTMIAEEALVANTADTTMRLAGNMTGETGIVRTLNNVDYPFHWRLFGNGGSLAECYQFIQRQLRRGEVTRGGGTEAPTDVDFGTDVNRGDVTDLLLTFVSPNGTGLDMFIDNLLGTEANNSTFVDLTGDSRNFAFIAGVTINLNQNLLDDGAGTGFDINKVVVFFTSVTGGDFGTNAAIIVNDSFASPMTFSNQATSPISTTFDYTNNAQGSRTPGTDAGITIVGIGLDSAQYVQVTGTITQVNENTFTLVSALERNFSNPA